MKQSLLYLIRFYTFLIRPLTSVLGACRFVPSCSEYASSAIRQYGAIRGLGLAIHRILRCHPLAKGGVDLP